MRGARHAAAHPPAPDQRLAVEGADPGVGHPPIRRTATVVAPYARHPGTFRPVVYSDFSRDHGVRDMRHRTINPGWWGMAITFSGRHTRIKRARPKGHHNPDVMGIQSPPRGTTLRRRYPINRPREV